MNTVTVTSTNLCDSVGNLYSGIVLFQPVLTSGLPTPYRVGGGGTVTDAAIEVIAHNGAFSVELPDTTQTSPKNICFRLIVPGITTGYDTLQPHTTATDSSDWCQGGVCNLDNYPPNLAPQVTVQEGPQGPQGIQGLPGLSGVPSGVVLIPFSASPVINATRGLQFKIVLTGNVTSSTFINGASGPTIIVVRIVQDSAGGHTFAWPSNMLNAGTPNTDANSTSVQMFAVNTDGSATAVGPMMYS
jgi:hypothetical protein